MAKIKTFVYNIKKCDDISALSQVATERFKWR